MRSVEVAAAPQIVRPIMDGVAKLCGFVTGNAALATLLVLLGAVVIITCVVLLVLRKWWPSTQIGQALQGGGTVGWCCAGITLGLCGILPSQNPPVRRRTGRHAVPDRVERHLPGVRTVGSCCSI